MTTTVLQWYDAKKEKPKRNGNCLVVHENFPCLIRVYYHNGLWSDECGGFLNDCCIESWVALPTADCIRQKFKDEELKKRG